MTAAVKSKKNVKKKKINDTVIIRKANELVEARYRFDIWEMRLFLKMLTMIRPDDKDFYEYKIYISDLIKDFRLENNKDTYVRVKDGARKLMTKIIKVLVKDEGNVVELETPIIGAVKKTLEEGDGSYVKLAFYPDMKQFLLELKNRYLVYDFKNVSNLPSPYYVRIYELLKQYEKIGERRFSVNELKEILGITTEYKLYGHFKSKIIDKAQAKLAEHTDISFTYKEIKRGRAIESLIFYIRHNRPKNAESDLFTNYEDVSDTDIHDVIDPALEAYIERLTEWWGVNPDNFAKRAQGKTVNDIENAIAFTKERIKLGKAENPAGVFLDALTRGLKTAQQVKTAQLAEKEREDRDRKEQLRTLQESLDGLSAEYAAAVNNAIRELTAENSAVTEGAIENIKNAYAEAGNKAIMLKTIDDFRNDSFLRELVKAEIKKMFPDKFEPIDGYFIQKIKGVQEQMRAII